MIQQSTVSLFCAGMQLVEEISKCTICAEQLPLGPRPIVSIHPDSRILIIGQAPGTKVHASGIPWDDHSGKNLRSWLGVDDEAFYDVTKFAIVPMGFCYPGRGKSGDLPPRPECAEKWHKPVLNMMPNIVLTLLIGQYAQKKYLGKACKRNLTETVKAFDNYMPKYLPLPHPSPRNNIWQKKNPWFQENLIPQLQSIIKHTLT